MAKSKSATPEQKTASNPAASAWVGANAGSGKTHVLVDRVTRLMLAGVDPMSVTATLDGVLYCHATPTSDLPITTAITDDAIVAQSFDGVVGTVVIGHTHHQFDRRVGDVRVFNAGSVGMPYEGDVAAFWAIVEDGEPRHMRTSIDVERAIAGIRASGWPGGDEFIVENLRVAVSRDDAIRQLEAQRP